jgi:hypothetical protein
MELSMKRRLCNTMLKWLSIQFPAECKRDWKKYRPACGLVIVDIDFIIHSTTKTKGANGAHIGMVWGSKYNDFFPIWFFKNRLTHLMSCLESSHMCDITNYNRYAPAV